MRNFLAGFSGGSGAFGAAAVVVLLIGAALWVQSGREAEEPASEVAIVMPDALEDTPEPAAVMPEKKQDEAAATEPAAKPDTQDEASVAPQLKAPAFDEVRREADGVTVIAGTAAAGAEVSILQNGVEVGKATADGTGKFATLAIIPPDGRGHVLSLMQKIGEAELASADEIILAPMDPPAEVEPTITATAGEDKGRSPTPPTAENETAKEETGPEQPAAPVAVAEVGEVEAPKKPETLAANTATAEVPTPPQTPLTQAPAAPDASAAQSVAVAAATPSSDEAAPKLSQALRNTPSKPAAVAVLKSTEAGVELLNTPGPEVMTNVAIDTISYSEEGAVQLAGRAQAKTKSVRVYLDNSSVVSLAVDADGRWRGALPDVDEGIYTLRVDEVSAEGDVTSRVETPFKREPVEVLVAAAGAQDGPIKAITVQKGATLWAIARDRYGDGALYVRVFEANTAAIRDPDLIYPGQIFDLPD
ncbi:Peptidoglycan-binding LysM [Sulfitobacter noctilucicola]|uniref:Nucleoid-associated protein YgaU n=1 Tax=Sulfitobacter noctilucicola TaxID=1342301 RepID=A0A7W6MC26_9RHOB|nr:LysM peptidoglycan-binding domain-containing protein [Sulfitobacter noctilucicola]KIN64118.1 Peptidoglycan-binding LysM [Sulfitobacter noctilucicola]MBB4175472.1 nucleoid-associated protein YgaU [Sulfitobacter noctilucicola]